MELKQLHYFITIADEGSISQAARKLYMSQPPLSSQMKLLEKEVGCTLFERGARNIKLTNAGQTLYNYAKSIMELSDIAALETKISAGIHNHTLRIGIVSSVICSCALSWINDFSKKYPDINFEIIEGNTYDLLQKFQSGQIHLAILRTPFEQENLTSYDIFTDKLVAIGKQEFFTSKKNFYSLEDLAKTPIILYRRWENLIKEAFKSKHLSPVYSCINDDARTTLYFVEAGMGIGIIPESATSLIQDSNIVCHKIDNLNISSNVVLSFNNSAYLPECSKLFIDYIKSIKSILQ